MNPRAWLLACLLACAAPTGANPATAPATDDEACAAADDNGACTPAASQLFSGTCGTPRANASASPFKASLGAPSSPRGSLSASASTGGSSSMLEPFTRRGS